MANFKFNYDKEHNKLLGTNKAKFEQIITLLLKKELEKLNLDLNVETDLSHNGPRICFINSKSSDELVKLMINLFEVKQLGCDIIAYVQRDVPPEQWVIMKKWYGKRVTFSNVLRHELHHWIDRKREGLGDKLFEDRLNNLERGFLLTIDRVRDESIPKLMESDKDISFFRDKLFQIRFNYLKLAKDIPLTEEALNKNGGNYFGAPLAGDHHYYLAIYMSHIIAYSFMKKNTVLNDSNKLKLKDIAKAIGSGLKIHSPSEDAKEKAMKKIMSASALEYMFLFEECAKKLKIPKDLQIMSKTFFDELMAECREQMKEAA